MTQRMTLRWQAGAGHSDPCLLSFNFISEDYYNNWTPETSTDESIELPDDWRDYVEPKNNKVITYQLAVDDTPYDWFNLDGTQKNVSSTAASGIEGLTLMLNGNDYTYTATAPDGTSISGGYTLSDNGVYSFGGDLPEVILSADGRATFKQGSDNALHILSYETDSYSGALSDLWLGALETDALGNDYQYMGYHFVPQTSDETEVFSAQLGFFDTGWSFNYSPTVYISSEGSYTFTISGSSSSPYGLYLDILDILDTYPNMDMVITDIQVDGSRVAFDDDIIERGVGDEASTARRYIVNPWGSTSGDASLYAFDSTIVVTVQVTFDTGSPFITD